MSDRRKGAALACKFGALKTAGIIATACYESIFASATAETCTSTLVEALAEANDAYWAYWPSAKSPTSPRSSVQRSAM
jgi:hypothetical protein